MSRNCAVCLNNDLILMDNTETDNSNIQLVTKLKECVAEIDWKTNSLICQVCVINLEQAYRFRMQCLNSETMRRGMVMEIVYDSTLKPVSSCTLRGFDRDDIHTSEPVCRSSTSAQRCDENMFDPICTDLNPICSTTSDTSNNSACDTTSDPICVSSDPIYVTSDPICIASNPIFVTSMDSINVTSNNTNITPDSNGIILDPIINVASDHMGVTTTPICISTTGPTNTNTTKPLHNDYKMKLRSTCSNETTNNIGNAKTITCFQCNETFLNETTLTEHIGEKHLLKYEELEVVTDFEINTDSYFTPKKYRGRYKFNCDICSETFKACREYVIHARVVHEIPPRVIKPYQCDVCYARFLNSSHLTLHKKYHEGKRSYPCNYCDKAFITNGDLKIHTKKHLNKREYKCDECPKSFNTHREVWAHKRVVHVDPNLWLYFCGLCNKRFPGKVNYEGHMRGHTGEKPFDCCYCDRSFADKVALHNHTKVHLKNKVQYPYKCDQCDKAYVSSQFLEVHVKKIHGVYPEQPVVNKSQKYSCSFCSSSFFAENTLKRHMETHSRERLYSCDVCNERFTSVLLVNQHLSEIHNVNVRMSSVPSIEDFNETHSNNVNVTE